MTMHGIDPEKLARACRRGKPAKGFTLVEMAIAIVVLGILAAITVPSFNSLIQNSRGKRAAETLNAFMVNAKSEAVKRNSVVRVVFTSSDAGATWCAGLTTSTTCDCTAVGAGGCQLDGVSRAVSSINFDGTILVAPASGTALGFDPSRGTATPNGGTITVQSEAGQQFNVVLSNRGRIRMCAPGASAGGYPQC